MAAWLTEQFIRQTTRDGETEEYLIAVIGVTGAGKSTFISKATGSKAVEIGNGCVHVSYTASSHSSSY
jgi:ABC-type uncharacterized transport system ATPase component